jgi:hypothetical protein
MTEITDKHLGLIAHSLGLSKKNKNPYRNYFAAEEGHADFKELEDLTAAGYMQKAKDPIAPGFIFSVTELGKDLIGLNKVLKVEGHKENNHSKDPLYFMLKAKKLILDERKRQNEKWGEQNHSPQDWMMILQEEIGEFACAEMEHRYRGADPKLIMEELIQVAAVVFQMVECGLRNDWG